MSPRIHKTSRHVGGIPQREKGTQNHGIHEAGSPGKAVPRGPGAVRHDYMGEPEEKRVENRGGRREGAGRPKKLGGPTVARTYRILASTDARIKNLTGSSPELRSEADVVDAAVKAFKP